MHNASNIKMCLRRTFKPLLFTDVGRRRSGKEMCVKRRDVIMALTPKAEAIPSPKQGYHTILMEYCLKSSVVLMYGSQ